MKSLKKIIKSTIITTITFIILTIILTAFNYFNLLNYKIINTFKLIIPICSIFIGGYLIGKKSEKKGWLEGIKFSLIISILLFLITILLNKFKLEYLLYLVIIAVSGTLGSIIGINKK
ncbi:MAG: TIGR04086 family membrane protein [Bacilli bacterium]|nr:TIGR04086 family membrane protein [Bacilli bacterium]